MCVEISRNYDTIVVGNNILSTRVSILEQCHSPPPLRWGVPIEKAVSGEYNLPVRMHGRADDEVIDQPTLFKRHV